MIYQGKVLAEKILAEIAIKTTGLRNVPRVFDYVVGDDKVSMSYANIKKRIAGRCGLDFSMIHLPLVDELEVVRDIVSKTKLDNVVGIIAQLPLPTTLNEYNVLSAIPEHLDIDCISPSQTEKFYFGNAVFVPPTALAVMKIIEDLEISKNKSILLIGKGKLVGRPLSYLLAKQGFKFEILDRSSADKEKLLKEADCIISATGSQDVFCPEQVKNGVVLIDCGTSEMNGAIVGDIDTNAFIDKASVIVPVPGGVGPITVACLLSNAVSQLG